MDYQDAVAEFRHLDDSIEAGQWRQAQLTWEQLQRKEDGTRLTYKQWAEAVDKSEWHVGVIYRVWARWGSTLDRPTFNDVYQIVGEGTDTVEEARAKTDLRRARSATSKLSADDKAALIEDLSDELPSNQQAQLVDRWLEESPAVRSRAREAIDRSDQRQQQLQQNVKPWTEPAYGDAEEEMVVTLMDFRKIQRTMTEITQRLQRSTLLRANRDYQDAVLAQTGWDRNALDIIETITNGGETTDEALARILDGGVA